MDYFPAIKTVFNIFILLSLKVLLCHGQLIVDVTLTSTTPSTTLTCPDSEQQIILDAVSHPSQECMDQAYLQFSRKCVRESSCELATADSPDCDMSQGDVVISAACVQSGQIIDICAPPSGVISYSVVYLVSDQFPETHRGNRRLSNCRVYYNQGGQASYKILFLSLMTREDGESCYSKFRAYEEEFLMVEYCGPSVSALVRTPASDTPHSDTELFSDLNFGFATSYAGEQKHGFVVKVKNPNPAITTTTNSAAATSTTTEMVPGGNGGVLTTTTTATTTQSGPCGSAPCQNAGRCTNIGQQGYRCTCIEEYTGGNCDIKLAELLDINYSSRTVTCAYLLISGLVTLFIFR